MRMSDVASVVDALDGVRSTTSNGLLQWRIHGRLVARQLDDTRIVIRADFEMRDLLLRRSPSTFEVPTRFRKHMMVVAHLRDGDPGAIEDALVGAWEMQQAR